MLFSCWLSGCSASQASRGMPDGISDFVREIQYERLGINKPEAHYEIISENLVKVSLTWFLEDTIRQDDWQVNIFPEFNPDFHWAPHLTPTDDHIIAQHVFRAPALIVSSSEQQLTIIPDLDLLEKGSPVDWYMDLNAIENKLTLGLSESEVKEHVLYTRKSGAVYPPGKVEFGFYILTDRNEAGIFNPWRKALTFFWERWGKPLYQSEEYAQKDLEPFAGHTYNWAFDSWKKNVWQEFEIKGKKVGAPTFIVNVTQSPNFPAEVNEREFRSIWNQAWFSSLRSAQGLYRYARRMNDQQLLEYALKTKELALSFPQKKGFFPGLIATEMEQIEVDGKKINRSKGWDTSYFGNSNRNPYSWDARKAPLHILDMSFTAYLMLTWYDELEKDERLLDYARTYGDALIKVQDDQGFFPGWLSADSLKPLKVLNKSPETSMSVTFLVTLYKLTNDEKYLQSALKAMHAVMDNIIPVGRWEDFETYWSCSRYGADYLINKKVERNNVYKQNNFSMYWTAEALFHCYKTTNDRKYLKYGQRTLDELLMTQATWQPPYMYVNTLGGFGVMNTDAEWNDARQSLFSELIISYGEELNKQEYIQRGLAALRASFLMMYCPENPKTKQQWESKWGFFGEEDYGFMMENYGHGGVTSSKGVGIGEFTIYDWGNGAASEAYNRMLDHYGKDFLMSGSL
jgi:rhamnogalacturonyl hydrolase YesR